MVVALLAGSDAPMILRPAGNIDRCVAPAACFVGIMDGEQWRFDDDGGDMQSFSCLLLLHASGVQGSYRD